MSSGPSNATVLLKIQYLGENVKLVGNHVSWTVRNAKQFSFAVSHGDLVVSGGKSEKSTQELINAITAQIKESISTDS